MVLDDVVADFALAVEAAEETAVEAEALPLGVIDSTVLVLSTTNWGV